MKNTQFHQTLFYRTDAGIHDKILDFLSQGIDEHVRCVFLTTQDDANLILQLLKEKNPSSDVVKLFSYFNLPDPIRDSESFEKKMEKIKSLILNPEFHGRIAFNVLGDMSRFSIKMISEITEIEKFLDSLSCTQIKLFCTFKTGKDNESSLEMMNMAMSTHDHAIFENEDGSFSQVIIR